MKNDGSFRMACIGGYRAPETVIPFRYAGYEWFVNNRSLSWSCGVRGWDDGNWEVSERTSGHRLMNTEAPTPREAIQKAIARIDQIIVQQGRCHLDHAIGLANTIHFGLEAAAPKSVY